MNRRSFLEEISKRLLLGLAAIQAFKPNLISGIRFTQEESSNEENSRELLKEIHREVVELGSYDDQPIIKREFFIDLDQHETNKEEHIVVMSHKEGDMEKMIVQVTYFEPKKHNHFIKEPKEIKNISCHIKGDNLEIKKCDFDEKDRKALFADILVGIRDKKKLLKLIEKK